MKILVGYDGSKVADDVIQLARKHAEAFNAKLYIITFLEQRQELEKDTIDKAESRVEKIKVSLKSDKSPCEAKVVVNYQSPGENLVQFAKKNEVDEILIGVKRRSKVGKFLFGSTAQYVILEAPCPVVTVK